MEVFHAKWVIGSIEPEEFVKLAIAALQDGFDGTALQQLAGLDKPTSRELGDLPKRAFTEQGLRPLTQEQAVELLVARGQLSPNLVLTALRQEVPDFEERWKQYVIEEHGSWGPFNDIAEFMHFVVDSYESGNLAETRHAFSALEKLLENADQETRNLIELGFFEDLQNYASHRPGGNAVYEQFFGPISRQIWAELKQIWAGKSSLAYVIHAENKAKRGK
jgi:hypothetical protein